MKNLKFALSFIFIFTFYLSFSQERPQGTKIKFTGKVVEKSSQQPLEYATITLLNPKHPKAISGGITDDKGEFNIETFPGTYTIKIEFISFKPFIITDKNILENTNLGQIDLEEDASQLKEVTVRSEKTTVEIKLDKKVYNVGKDLMVRGGKVSDVLDNIPSVTVDVDGNVSLRGNGNVKILIDGKPSNANNIADVIKTLPADAIEKVEVVTNPSARYDAEGGAGLLNIILKKGSGLGFNGSTTLTIGNPDNYGFTGTLNYKSKKINLFTTQGYSYRNAPGKGFVETNYLNASSGEPNYVKDNRKTERNDSGYNGVFGFDLYLNKSSTWTNTVNYRENSGKDKDYVLFDNQYSNPLLNNFTFRDSKDNSNSKSVEYLSSFQKNFKKEGHKFTADVQFANSTDNTEANIINDKNITDFTINNQKQNRSMFQTDYVLPLGKGSQFEAGYRGSFSKQTTDVLVKENNIINVNYTNIFEYNENVNALYSQYGFKKGKISTLFGLRWEDSKLNINQLTSSDFNTKKYNNFFPSAFFTYQLAEQTSVSVNYSRRINRPRGRMINPFNNFSSNINLFKGNPDLNPAMTNSLSLEYLKKWTKITLNTSIYANNTSDVFQMVRKESGTFVNGVPVILTSPINLSKEFRTGFEFTLNYSPFKWWKMNSNFNFFNVITKGDYSYLDFNNQSVTQNFDSNANSWFTKFSSRITLPKKVDWQTNFTYNGSQKTAQGKVLGVFAMNLAFSKDILKDKGSLSLSVNDVFNSRKRKMETYLPISSIQSYAEMQFHQRQINLSFTYRFNKQKNEKEKQPKRDSENGGGEEF